MKRKVFLLSVPVLMAVGVAIMVPVIAQTTAERPPAPPPPAAENPPGVRPPGGADATGKGDKVRDTPITITTSYGTVSLHESVNDAHRFYVAPNFRFLLLAPDAKVIARPGQSAFAGSVPVQMSVEMVHPEIRAELIAKLRNPGREVNVTDVRNLQVDSIRIGVAATQDREAYGVEDFVLTNPQPGAEKLAVHLSVRASKADQFAKAVNDGMVNLVVSYSYNQISLDSRVESLRTSKLLDTNQVRELTMTGAELMSAEQMARVSANIKTEIESKVIAGVGKIDPQSLPLDRLMEVFSVGKTWEKSEADLAAVDERLRRQFDLKVNPKEFQPYRYQKRVIEMLARETGVANKKKAYFDLYRREASAMKGSAGLKIGPFGASADYSKEFEQAMAKGDMTDDEFREHVRAYHGAEYTKEMVEFRGVELYDVQKVRTLGEREILSVTVVPTLGTGVRNLTLTPTVKGAQYVERRFQSIDEQFVAVGEKLKANADAAAALKAEFARYGQAQATRGVENLSFIAINTTLVREGLSPSPGHGIVNVVKGEGKNTFDLSHVIPKDNEVVAVFPFHWSTDCGRDKFGIITAGSSGPRNVTVEVYKRDKSGDEYGFATAIIFRPKR